MPQTCCCHLVGKPGQMQEEERTWLWDWLSLYLWYAFSRRFSRMRICFCICSQGRDAVELAVSITPMHVQQAAPNRRLDPVKLQDCTLGPPRGTAASKAQCLRSCWSTRSQARTCPPYKKLLVLTAMVLSWAALTPPIALR